MKIEREAFIGPLRLLRPALVDKSPVEGLNQIWLSGDTATAFNDIIAIEVALPMSVEGGVHGMTLLGMLEASTAKEIDIDKGNKDGDSLALKSAGMKAELPLIPSDRAVFAFPETLPEGIVVDKALSAALKHVSLALSSGGDNMGVTFVAEGAQLAVYATDGMTVAWSRLKKPKGYTAKRVVLSPTFCDQLSVLNEGGMSLALTDDAAVAVDNQSGSRLFGRLVEVAKELDFAGTIKGNVPTPASAVPLPERLANALDRAEVLVNGVARKPLRITIKQNVLRLYLKTDMGELSEALKIDGKHPDAEGLFNGAFIRRALGRCDRFVLSSECFAMLGEGDSGFLVAATDEG